MNFQKVKKNAVTALLDNDVDLIAHCCNCQNTFGSGIAREIRERIPSAYDADTEAYQRSDSLLGKWSSDGKVVNLYGQEFFGSGKRQINYGAYANALSSFVNEYLSSGGSQETIIGFPYKIGSDRAGGDWDIVCEITEGIMQSNSMKMIWFSLE